jgi:hypothetical protein
MTTRLLRQPIAHFVVLGAALYGASHVATSSRATPTARAPIVVDAARIEQLATDYARQLGAAPTRAQLAGLIAAAVDDELLAREARVARLDVGDKSVRLRLVQKMRAVSDDPTLDDDALYRAALTLGLDDDLVIQRVLAQKMRLVLVRDDHAVAPDDATLAAWMRAHRADWATAPSVSVTQLFLSARTHGAHLAADAAALLAWLRRDDPPPARATTRSDPFVLGTTMQARTRDELARQLGSGFADAVMALPTGRWAGPIASPYGLHLVRVDERQAATLPPLGAVRRQVRLAVEDARAIERLRAGLARLRRVYDVRVDERAIPAALAAAAATPRAPLASAESAP